MALVRPLAGKLDMIGLGFGPGELTFSSNTIRLTYPDGGFAEFEGSFSMGRRGRINGTIDSMTSSGDHSFSIAEIGMGASRIFDAIQAGDFTGAANKLLGGRDTITGSNLRDILFGADGDDKLYGGMGNDAIDGGGGVDRLYGELGRDTLDGSDANDLIDGGTGGDRMTGGGGGDRFVISADSGSTRGKVDYVLDFNAAEDDVIDLFSIDAIDGGKDDAFWIAEELAFGEPGRLVVHSLGDNAWEIMGYTSYTPDGGGNMIRFVVVSEEMPIFSDFIL